MREHPTVSNYSRRSRYVCPDALIWIISLASIALMLVRPRGLPEWVWIGAARCCWSSHRLLPVGGALHAIREGVDVCLFLTGMMILAELAREEGVFDWVADIAVRHARGSASRLFLWVYLVGIAVTALLSNDATAVVLTPAVLAAVRRAKVDPRPHLLACALIANAASFLLPIANPANLVVYGDHLPPLGQWMRMFLLPSIASVVATFVCLRLLSRKALTGEAAPVTEAYRLDAAGWLALAGIGIAAVTLLVSSALDVQLGAPTFGAGVLALVLVALKDRAAPKTAVRNVAWSVLPLVAGLFILVEALNRAGMLGLMRTGLTWLAAAHGWHRKVSLADSAVALLSNVMNNLPSGLAAGNGAAADGTAWAAGARGADRCGPGAESVGDGLAGDDPVADRAAPREDAEITGWEFLKIGSGRDASGAGVGTAGAEMMAAKDGGQRKDGQLRTGQRAPAAHCATPADL
jgi:arsenical pump membrane protein